MLALLLVILSVSYLGSINALSISKISSSSSFIKTINTRRTMSLSSTTSSTSSSASSASTAVTKSSLKDLCEISKDACDAVSPMLSAFYSKIRFAAGESSTAKLKSDATFFSIADGIVQHMFIQYLFKGNKFKEIVGEEDETNVNILKKPYTVDDLVVPDEFDAVIESTLEKIKSLSSKIDSNSYKDITIFVDPIDGTREFATGQGQYVTILIGYNDQKGQPVAGIMYRPLTEPQTYATGCKKENFKMSNLDYAKEPKPNGLLITDGKVSKFLSNLIDELGYERVPSVASGNRAMMILEGKAGLYIRDTGGFAKWDTSGPQAVIEAFGGCMSKLPQFIENKSLVTYTHLKTNTNLDFKSNEIALSLSNARDKELYNKEKSVMITDVNVVKEYSCLQGLVTLDKSNLDANINKIHEAMIKVSKQTPPTYT